MIRVEYQNTVYAVYIPGMDTIVWEDYSKAMLCVAAYAKDMQCDVVLGISCICAIYNL